MVLLFAVGYILFATFFYAAMTKNARYRQDDDSGIPEQAAAHLILLEFPDRDERAAA